MITYIIKGTPLLWMPLTEILLKIKLVWNKDSNSKPLVSGNTCILTGSYLEGKTFYILRRDPLIGWSAISHVVGSTIILLHHLLLRLLLITIGYHLLKLSLIIQGWCGRCLHNLNMLPSGHGG